MQVWDLEPVRVAAAVRAVLVALAAFGAGLSGEQIAAVVVAVEVVGAVLVRPKVTPVAKPCDCESCVAAKVDAAGA